MTQEDKLKAVVEAAGGCWHKAGHPLYATPCVKCGKEMNIPASQPWNPSPTDLNALFELAEKLGYRFAIRRLATGVYNVVCRLRDDPGYKVWADDNPAEALLNALYKSIKGEKGEG